MSMEKKLNKFLDELIQEVETEFIKIIQYQYTFFNGESTNLSLEDN